MHYKAQGYPGTMPLISVIIPVRDGAAFLSDALDSVFAQHHRPLDVIVVDDGSTDASCEVAEAHAGDVRILSQPPLGLGAARNSGLRAAKGNHIAFLDADDLWIPSKLNRQLAMIEEGCEIVFSQAEEFLTPELEQAGDTRFAVRRGTLRGIISSAALFTRRALDTVGPFDEKLAVGEFLDWLSRAKHRNLAVCMVEEVLVRRRIHGNNTGINRKDERKDYVRVLHRAIARRRTHAKTHND